MNFVSVISCATWPLTVFASLSGIYIHSSSFEDPISCLHTVNSTTTHIHHNGPAAQINVDVVNFKEYAFR